jgi:hypothetical protein
MSFQLIVLIFLSPAYLGSMQPCQLQELLSSLQNCLQAARGDYSYLKLFNGNNYMIIYFVVWARVTKPTSLLLKPGRKH